jgi:hypothetical protein
VNASTWKREPIEIPIAEPALCVSACREIYAQRTRWRARILNDQPPFYTLGAASYLDLGFTAGSIDDYLSDAGSLWQWAGESVLAVIDRVRARLADQLEQPVEYPPTLPSPGFHIFIGRAIPRVDCGGKREDCGSCHFDLQHEFIPWARWYTNVDVENTISFTLPLNLPAAGGGLIIWESLSLERMRDYIRKDRIGEIESAAHATPGTTLRYAVGRLVLHNGHMFHQMAGVPKISVRDERITLQGHGVLADGVWRLYW